MRTITKPSVVVALLTPFTAEEEVDLEALREHVEFLVDEGVDGLMPCGTTGEGPLLDEEEVAAVVRETVRAADGRASVLAHVGRAGTAATVRLARRAVADGADAVSAVVPYFYGLRDSQLRSHYEALIEAARGTPAFAYTIPERTGNELPAEVAHELAGHGLAGVKDSTKSFERHREYLAIGFDVLMGSDGMVAEAFEAGAAGCVSAIANARPDLLLRLKRAHLDGDGDGARATQGEISALRNELQEEPPLVRIKQALADRLGYPPHLRAPLG